MGPIWHDALRAYRRRSLATQVDEGAAHALFVVCSEDHAASALVAACRPAMTLQTLSGHGDEATRAMLEYAVRGRGIRTIVVCGHAGCHADGGPLGARASRARTAARARALRDDLELGPMLRSGGVIVRALWFDADEGDVYACDLEGERAALVDDVEFAEMLAALGR